MLKLVHATLLEAWMIKATLQTMLKQSRFYATRTISTHSFKSVALFLSFGNKKASQLTLQ